MNGYNTPEGYMGLVKGKYQLFASEEYLELHKSDFKSDFEWNEVICSLGLADCDIDDNFGFGCFCIVDEESLLKHNEE